MTLTLEHFRKALTASLDEIRQKTGQNYVYAARLAVELNRQLRVLTGRPEFRLDGHIFGPVLYPDSAAPNWVEMKFRDFLYAFPDIVEVEPTSSGDLVRVKRVESGEVRHKHFVGLNVEPKTGIPASRDSAQREAIQELHEIVSEMCGESGGPVPVISAFLKASEAVRATLRSAVSETGSLIGVLQSYPSSFLVSYPEFGGLLQPVETVPEAASKPGYLIVDSASIMGQLGDIIGARPTPSQRPNWDVLADYISSGFPASEWKLRYFHVVQSVQHESVPIAAEKTEAFTRYIGFLEATGYSVISLENDDVDSDYKRRHQSRLSTSRQAIQQFIEKLAEIPSHLALVTNQRELLEIAAARSNDPSVGATVLCGLRSDFLEAHSEAWNTPRLRVVDLESDVRAFNERLPQRKSVTVEQFDAARFL